MKYKIQLFECPICKGQVSNVANFCPHCGTPMEIINDVITEKTNAIISRKRNKIKNIVMELKNDVVTEEFNKFKISKSATVPEKWDEFKDKLNEYKTNIDCYNAFISRCDTKLNLTNEQLTRLEKENYKNSPFYNADYYDQLFIKIKREVIKDNKEPAIIEALTLQMSYSYNLSLRKRGVINFYPTNPRIKANYSNDIYEVVSEIDSKIKYTKFGKTPDSRSARAELRAYGITNIINSIKDYYKNIFNVAILENSTRFVKELDKIIDTCDAQDVFAVSGLPVDIIRKIPITKAANPLKEYQELFKLK